MGIYVTNDLLEPWEGAVHWWLETLDGRVIESGQSPAYAAPQSATAVRTLDFSDHLSDDTRRELIFITELVQGDRRIALQAATFVPTKHLELHDPQVKASLRSEEGRLVIELEAHSLARLVEVLLEGADVVFTDNYFDLPAGRRVTVACPLPAGWTLAQAQAALRIRSVYDSYAHRQ
jgi:beta-mannosidase